jgi:hypothetical protein
MIQVSPNHPVSRMSDGSIRGALIVGDAICLGPASSVTCIASPPDSPEVSLVVDGNGFSATVEAAGVYSWTVVHPVETLRVNTVVFPVAARDHYLLRPLSDQQQRLVLQSLARDVVLGVADELLPGDSWNSLALIGQPASRGTIDLTVYGGAR